MHTFLHTLLHLLTGFRNILLQCDPCHHRYLLDIEERGKINHLNQHACMTVFILLLPFAKTRHLPFANGNALDVLGIYAIISAFDSPPTLHSWINKNGLGS